MKKNNRWILIVLILAGLVSACASKPATSEKIPPSRTEDIDGSDFKRLILTEKAAERLDIQTTPVSVKGDQKIIPYAAVLYGLDGETWIYTNPEPLVFVRYPIVIDYIDGDMVVLTDGPDVDTSVVTVGVSLLYGAETGVSK